MRTVFVALLCLVAVAPKAAAQEIFRSVHSANLPTARIQPRSTWLFEISHRSFTPVSEGADELWGLDGPMSIRLGLAYSVHDRVQLGVLRTNFFDNLEFNTKVLLWSGGGEALPIAVAAMAGVSLNPDVNVTPTLEDNEMQANGQLILNALLGGRFAIGVVPTFVHNPRLLDADADNRFGVGFHGQVYLNPSMSVLAEWVAGEGNVETPNDPITLGVEFNTFGHVFKLVTTNQERINPAQLFGGAVTPFDLDEWRVGFNITRVLPF